MSKVLAQALCTLTAGLAIAGAAHAEPYTLKYTATITSIEDSQQFPIPSYTSASADGNVISINDTVTGYFTLDTSIPPMQSSTSWARYELDEAFGHTIVFDKTGYSQQATTYQSQIDVVTASDGGWDHDSVTFVAPMYYLAGPGYVAQTTLTFQAPAGTLGDTALPTSLSPFTGWFTYAYVSYAEEQTLVFEGSITSVSIVSSVPEPGTYVMLLAGLGLVAWRGRGRG